MTGNNRIPIVKERWYHSKGTVSPKSCNGTPYISALKDGVLRCWPDKSLGAAVKRASDKDCLITMNHDCGYRIHPKKESMRSTFVMNLD